MLGGMLGRNGVDGEGHMPPMYVDWSWQNAGYIPVSSMPVDPFDAVAEPVPGRLAFGEVSNEPLTSLDVVGHELGHGMDRYTPGGSSNFWVAEFVADIFGVATEWYANQAPPYDTPDWTILDSVLNSPRLRRMDDPASSTPPMATCYDRLAANFPGDIHLAAGPGDHWFYLLAEGTNAATCNGSAVGAIGFWPAFQIFYHAMLLKTTRSSYPAYRAWTAAAARNLFGCEAERAVLRAWDAVAVPNSYASPLVQVATPICGLNQ
jgi:Zn-dependent metalloprotease